MDINLAGMLGLCKSPISRRGIFWSMINHVLSSSTPFNISIDTTTWEESDSVQLREEVAAWRTKHLGGKLRAKKVKVHIMEPGSSFIAAIIEGIDEVEDLNVFNSHRAAENLPPSTVPTIFTKFQTLRKLKINHVELTSMDIFLEPRRVSLEVLEVTNMRLEDPESFTRFARALGDTHMPIARSLRTLFMEGSFSTGAFRITTKEAEAICQALETNDTLASFYATVYTARDQIMPLHQRFQAHRGRFLLAKL